MGWQARGDRVAWQHSAMLAPPLRAAAGPALPANACHPSTLHPELPRHAPNQPKPAAPRTSLERGTTKSVRPSYWATHSPRAALGTTTSREVRFSVSTRRPGGTRPDRSRTARLPCCLRAAACSWLRSCPNSVTFICGRGGGKWRGRGPGAQLEQQAPGQRAPRRPARRQWQARSRGVP